MTISEKALKAVYQRRPDVPRRISPAAERH